MGSEAFDQGTGFRGAACRNCKDYGAGFCGVLSRFQTMPTVSLLVPFYGLTHLI